MKNEKIKNYIPHPYVPRVNKGGNFCGHIPSNPKFSLSTPIQKGKGGLPGVLTSLIERMVRYYYQPEIIPTLNATNDSDRRQRSERREAIVCVLAFLVSRADLVSLRVGIPTSDGFMSYDISYISKICGLNTKRVHRAIYCLKSSGLLTVSQPTELLENGKYRGLVAVKAINKKLFAIFGLGKRLKVERDKASARLKKKVLAGDQLSPKDKARAGLISDVLRNQLKRGRQSTKTSNSPHIEIEYRAALIEAMREGLRGDEARSRAKWLIKKKYPNELIA